MFLASSAVANTVAGDLLVYFVCPCMVAVVIGLITNMRTNSKRHQTNETALLMLLQEVNPPSKPSLRDMMQDIRLKQGDMTGETALVRQALQLHIDGHK